MSRRGVRKEGGWEQTALRVLSYPANLAFAGIAAFVLSIGLITALPAAIAAARSMDGWLREDSTTVFTSTFREFAATWKRSLPMGVLALLLMVVLSGNFYFLWLQITEGTSGVALAIGAASVPVAISVILMLLAIPVAASRNKDGTAREWIVESVYLLVRRPIQAAFLLILTGATLFTCVLLPTIAPFLGISLPAYLALISLGDAVSSTPTEETRRGEGTV